MFHQKTATLLFASLLLIGHSAQAQGWRWGKGPKFHPSTPYLGGFYPGPQTVDSTGNVFISGGTFNLYSSVFGPDSLAVAPSSGIQAVVAKADSSGSFRWAVGTHFGNSLPIGVATNASGCLYVLGTYYLDTICVIGPDTLKCAAGNSSSVFYIAKIDPNGNVIWAKNIAKPMGYSPIISLGAFGGLATDESGNLYATAVFTNPVIVIGTDTLLNADASGATTDFFVAKFDSSGNALWAQRYGGTDDDYSNAIAATPHGSAYIAGSFSSSSISIGTTLTKTAAGAVNNFFIAKLNTNGTPNWARSSNGNTMLFNDAGGIATDQEGSVYFTGGFFQNALKFGSTTITHSGDECLFIVKYDSAGNVRWAKTASSAYSRGYGVSADICGNVWACGLMTNSLNFSGHTIATPANPYDPMYIVQFDTAGNYISGMALQNGGGGQNNINTDNRGNLFVSGDFVSDSGLTQFVIGPDTMVSDSDYQNLFVGRYTYGNWCIVDHTQVNTLPNGDDEIMIFPNPATDKFTVHRRIPFTTGAKAELFDMMGRLIIRAPLTGSDIELSLNNVSPGVYLARIYPGSNSFTTRKVSVVR